MGLLKVTIWGAKFARAKTGFNPLGLSMKLLDVLVDVVSPLRVAKLHFLLSLFVVLFRDLCV